MSVDVLLGLGSSLGDRNRHIQLALRFLSVHTSIHISRISRIYKSVPLGEADSLFWNLCCIVETSLSPKELLETIKKIEKKVGRKEARRWVNRIIDIDILLFGSDCISETVLIIPHSQFCHRAFVLQPALEIAGNWIHPQKGCVLKDLPIPNPRCWSN
ncbi:MAG: 2-amino-4-hydroxy-6-hydroxymethyldihydropteridine diphosphokinase [Deltaproteobacteria bacterium]|nr:2-amino-4-hydroxy-6-hydroxymethyldihydropteridine diphosphokinase [Deltaproteobacteria bacterium]